MPLASLSASTVGRSAAIVGGALAVALFAGCGSGSSSTGSSGSGVKQITTAIGGAEIFKGAGCTSCHTLAAAGSKGNIGPNLDEEKPSADKVVGKVTNGDGSMPAFKGRLTEAQIQAVADYVAQVAGK